MKATNVKLNNHNYCLFLIVFLFIMLCFACFNVFVLTSAAFADSGQYDEWDNVFYKTADELRLIDARTCSIAKRIIYDIYLRELGIVYEFGDKNSDGYVIIIKDNDDLLVTEASDSSSSPFCHIDGTPVYIQEFCYLEEIDGNYHSLDGTKVASTVNELVDLYKNHYCAIGDSLTIGAKTISYVSKSEKEKKLAKVIPEYYYEIRSNACVPISAANVIAYYDRFHTNLIESYVPGRGMGNFYAYREQNHTIESLIANLYDLMQTNRDCAGTTIAQFKAGLAQYCTSKGYTLELSSAMSGQSLNYGFSKQQIDANKPLILFMREMEIANITAKESQDVYNILYGKVAHSLSVFGYKEISYNLPDGSTSKSDFLLVSTGIKRCPKAYLNVYNRLGVDDAYIVQISE